ncbi:hypothetical protein [Limnospira platensis]|uniref:hypothetical protein n=1 Tax=Limnospira platensis TaxID=118562 RepID=UPI003D6E335D
MPSLSLTIADKRRAKTQAIKQGMMQELLTGRTRLIIDRDNTNNRKSAPILRG